MPQQIGRKGAWARFCSFILPFLFCFRKQMYHRQQNKYYPPRCLLSKLHSILGVANLLAHNNISHICYCGQISLRSAAVNCSFSDSLTPLWVTFILLAMLHLFRTNLFSSTKIISITLVLSYFYQKGNTKLIPHRINEVLLSHIVIYIHIYIYIYIIKIKICNNCEKSKYASILNS